MTLQTLKSTRACWKALIPLFISFELDNQGRSSSLKVYHTQGLVNNKNNNHYNLGICTHQIKFPRPKMDKKCDNQTF